MKIFLLSEYYPAYLNSFYAVNDVSQLNYHEHIEKLLDDYFGAFVSYYRHFRRQGHETFLAIGNDYQLQEKWVRENNVNISAGPQNKYQAVLRQLEEFKPDAFFMGSMFDYYRDFLRQVSDVTKNIFTWIACPYPRDLDFRAVRCVLSSAGQFVDEFRAKGLNAEILGAAFDGDITRFLDNEKSIDVSFIGGLSRKLHSYRVDGLEHLVRSGLPLRVFGYGLKKSIVPFLRSPLWNVYGGEQWGMKMYRTLNASRITLNFHIDIAKGSAVNMRLYEATGCGALLMTEESSGLAEKFAPGREVVSFRDFDDLADKISYYLAHEEERVAIASAGQKACLLKHGYDTRIVEFENIIQKYGE